MDKKTKQILGIVVVLVILVAAGSYSNRSGSEMASNDGAVFGLLTRSTSKSVAPQAMPTMDMASSFMAEESLGFIPEPYETAGETAADTEARIRRNGYIDMLVRDVFETIDTVEGIATDADGFVQDANQGEMEDGTRFGHITVRVPADRFEETVNAVEALADRVENLSTNAEDVTEQYTDLQAQLSNAQAEEEAYLALLDRSTSVSDIIEVQRELSRVRSRVESLEGRIQYLENQTDFSTINVSLREEGRVKAPTKEFRLGEIVRDAARELVKVGQDVVAGLIRFFIVGLGTIVPIGLVIWLGYFVYKKVRK